MSPSLVHPAPDVRHRMQHTPQHDNPAELAVRSGLHRTGLRFRVHYRPVPGSRVEADIAFPAQQVAVMLDGCFWHGCPEHGTMPKRNAAWWREKLGANKERDVRAGKALNAAGWQVMRFWEHERVEVVVVAVAAAVHTERRGAGGAQSAT